MIRTLTRQVVLAPGSIAHPWDTASAPPISYRLIQGCGDSIDFDCPEMGQTRRAAIGAATASRRLILSPTGQETVIRRLCAESRAHSRAFSR